MGKNMIDLDKKNFNKFISDGIVVVDFWAAWCGPCKIMAPIFEEIANEMKGKVKFGKVDVDSESELAQRFQVMSIPTTIFFKDGEQVDRAVGAMPKEDLVEKIKDARNS